MFQYNINLCKVHYKYTQEPEVLWFKVLDMVLEIQHSKIIPLADNFTFRSFAKFYNSLVTGLFEEVVKFVELEKLIEKLEKSYGEMKLGPLKRSILNLLLNYESERIVNQSIQRVALEENYSIVSGVIKCRRGGIASGILICHFCKEAMSRTSTFLFFKCGHNLCVSCQTMKFPGVSPICIFCESFESSKSNHFFETLTKALS